MLNGLQDYIDQHNGDILIVLHQMGNHGPAYYKRYPNEFERFTPVCPTSDLGSCTPEEIDNTYDNAILYTDHFLAKVIELLKRTTTNSRPPCSTSATTASRSVNTASTSTACPTRWHPTRNATFLRSYGLAKGSSMTSRRLAGRAQPPPVVPG